MSDSDSDSDWGSDSDDDNGTLPQQTGLPVVPEVTKKPKTEIPLQQVFLAYPVQLFLDSSVVNSRARIAGATIIYTLKEESWKVFFYDQNRRSIITVDLNPDFASTSKKSKNFKAPCDFSLYDGDDPTQMTSATISDDMKRGWKILFRTREEAYRYLTFLAISIVCLRAAKAPEPNCLIDVMKGKGKSCKPKQYAQCVCRVWRLEINSEKPNLTQPLPPHLANFDPKFDDTYSLLYKQFENIPVEESSTEGKEKYMCPQTLGNVIQKMKVGGERLFVIPAVCQLAQYLIENTNVNVEDVCTPGYIFIGSITVSSASKKKKKNKKKSKKKEEKEKKEEKNEKKIMEGIPTEVDIAVQQTIAKDKNQEEDLFSSSDDDIESSKQQIPRGAIGLPGISKPTGGTPCFPMPNTQAHTQVRANTLPPETSKVDMTKDTPNVNNLTQILEALKLSVNSINHFQRQVLEHHIKIVYDKLSKDLNLSSLPQQDIKKKIIKTHLTQLLTDYGKKNKYDSSGTIKHTEDSMQNFWNAIHPLVSPGGAFSKQGLNKLQKSGGKEQLKKKEKEFSRELEKLNVKIQKLEQDNKKLKQEKDSVMAQLTSQGETQMDLAEKKLNMIDEVEDIEKKLKQKVEMSNVFEQGTNDLRTQYEKEVSKKSQLEREIEDLSNQQQRFKRTWIPHKSVKHCMICQDSFNMFGKKSQHYCRYCGRLFCAACMEKMKIPEFGYKELVRVCRYCYEFKNNNTQDDN